MTASCGAERHWLIVVWESDTELIVVVCIRCGHRLLSAHESQGSFVWEYMRANNNGGD
ncbi:hypothetical protein SAMN05421805_103148 [Saccharopolyspora antimicrobica]|uniref:Uncharacterized protein n=1 Tax=Saccharopolyspora antimicrobica TaxID=455193 RepID=A0A1I4X0T1_9PSEU|nr:hypothetical protein [Saccharopolyspora antimicrobica]RKT84222.1 hypothetical protein ATL45_2532 [Saccharopolyspora antimicrobica]SFN18839.1 hypothetical protein SAMN05421805_103148 [Saccharopolyspora antimicrobica]